VIIHGNALDSITDAYKRYLEDGSASSSSSRARRFGSNSADTVNPYVRTA
jgi:hypothetical protein